MNILGIDIRAMIVFLGIILFVVWGVRLIKAAKRVKKKRIKGIAILSFIDLGIVAVVGCLLLVKPLDEFYAWVSFAFGLFIFIMVSWMFLIARKLKKGG